LRAAAKELAAPRFHPQGRFPPCSTEAFLLAAGARRMGSPYGVKPRASVVGRFAPARRKAATSPAPFQARAFRLAGA